MIVLSTRVNLRYKTRNVHTVQMNACQETRDLPTVEIKVNQETINLPTVEKYEFQVNRLTPYPIECISENRRLTSCWNKYMKRQETYFLMKLMHANGQYNYVLFKWFYDKNDLHPIQMNKCMFRVKRLAFYSSEGMSWDKSHTYYSNK